MGERKVLNKYYPPDFDPSKIPKRIPLKNEQMKVRMMLPMSIRCNTCGTYMYKGTKFNCRKEDVVGDTYLGLMKFRFYFKCTKCSAEMVMKTDPKNSDYEMESGASRNFEPWRASDEQKAAAKRQREEEEMGDAMRALENRTLDSKMEMDILAALDEMKSMRARQATLDPAAVLEVLQRSAGGAGGSGGGVLADPKQLTEEDEELIKKIVFRKSEKFVKRIESDEEDEGEDGERAEANNKDQQGGVKRACIAANGGEAEAGGGAAFGDNGIAMGSREPSAAAESVRTALTTQDEAALAATLGAGGSVASAAAGSGAAGAAASSAFENRRSRFVQEDPRPAFEAKPVKVAFMVKAKSKAPDRATLTSRDAGKGSSGSKDSRGDSGAEIARGNADGSGGSSAGCLRRDDEEKGKAALTNLLSTYGSDDDDEEDE
ncbi:unnamed protein product [Closterium sp. Yama58-4]|nr:unnamed protein product [Closterium sp. Yama58-4]